MEKYYVYFHRCPITADVMYVGHGKYARAWHFNGGASNSNRSEEHNKWLQETMDKGWFPDSFVELKECRLSKEEACKREQEYIREIAPPFNKPMGKDILKFTPKIQDHAKLLRGQGLSYKRIGELLGLSTMTIHRGLTGATKNAI